MDSNSMSATPSSSSATTVDTTTVRSSLTPAAVDNVIVQLETLTHIFYSNSGNQDINQWNEAQSKLLQFQQMSDPFTMCRAIIEKSQNSLVLFQAAMCLKNAVSKEWRKMEVDEVSDLFQFLSEFLCAKSLDYEYSLSETVSLVCAMLLKRLAMCRYQDEVSKKVEQVIATLCSRVEDNNEALNRRYGCILMLNSLLLECQASKRSTSLGLQIWRHFSARKMIESHLKGIAEVCLKTINWSLSSNLLIPTNPISRETLAICNFTKSCIEAVEHALSWNSLDVACAGAGDRILRIFQNRQIGTINQAGEHDKRLKAIHSWYELIMNPEVVKFLFDLYNKIKSLVDPSSNWNWPSSTLRVCMSCLFHLADSQNILLTDKDDVRARFVENLMRGAMNLMTSVVEKVDDCYEIANLLTAIVLHLEQRRMIVVYDKSVLNSFIEVAAQFSCKVFIYTASSLNEEEEKSVDALMDVWSIIVRSLDAYSKLEAELKLSSPITIDISSCARSITECYLRCHLNKPLGILEPNEEQEEVDIDNIEDYDDGVVHSMQLDSFGFIARVDAAHTCRLLIDLLGTRVQQFEALLAHSIPTRDGPEGMKEWETINDDLHWLLLMTSNFLTLAGYGDIGVMSNEIIRLSIDAKADVDRTVAALGNLDYSSNDTDPIIRLVIIVLKLCQIEKSVCQSGKRLWLSSQTSSTLTTFMSKFCLTYIYPLESEYPTISPPLNYCFGQDSQTAEKLIEFVLDHACCKILFMKDEQQVVMRCVELFIQLLRYLPKPFINDKLPEIIQRSEMIKLFTMQLSPDNMQTFLPKTAKTLFKLATKLLRKETEWTSLVSFLQSRWTQITATLSGQLQPQVVTSDVVLNKFLEFCDYASGVCEASDDDNIERIFEQLLLPLVKELPAIMMAFRNFESAMTAIFDLLYLIVKVPLACMGIWEGPPIETFYCSSTDVLKAYAHINSGRTLKSDDEESCDGLLACLQFMTEAMKKDWGSNVLACCYMIVTGMELIGPIIKPEYLQLPKVRQLYYRLLLYLCDEEERLENLSNDLIQNVISKVLLSLRSNFDKETDSHCMSIVCIMCRYIFKEKGNSKSERMAGFVQPCLSAIFEIITNRNLLSSGGDYCENMSSAFFSLRVCFPELYNAHVEQLIQRQDDQYVQQQIRSLFIKLEDELVLTVSRVSCREFSTRFEPFLAELHQYIGFK